MRVEPRPKGAVIAQPIERSPGAQSRLVDGVLGVASIAQDPGRELVGRAQLRGGKPPELLAFVGVQAEPSAGDIPTAAVFSHRDQVWHRLFVLFTPFQTRGGGQSLATGA